MKKKICTALLAAAVMAVSACGDLSSLSSLLDAGSAGKWINSDIRESYDGVGEIRPEDDFAAVINRDWVVSQDKDDPNGAITRITEASYSRQRAILEDDSLNEPDILELKKFAELASDWENRNAHGVSPLKKYTDIIGSLGSKEDIYRWICDPVQNPLGMSIVIIKDLERSTQTDSGLSAAWDNPQLSLEVNRNTEAYTKMNATAIDIKTRTDTFLLYMLTRLGYTEDEAKRLITACYKYEKRLLFEHLSGLSDNRFFTADEMMNDAGSYPFMEYMNAFGFKYPLSVYTDRLYIRKLDSLCEDVEGFKAMMTVQYIMTFADKLDREAYDRFNVRNSSLLQENPGTNGTVDESRKDDILLFDNYIAKSCMTAIMGKYYTRKYYTEEDKERLYSMTEDIIEAFREDLDSLDWLSDEGKAAAKEKLDNMFLNIIDPAYDSVSYDDIDIVSKADGGNFAEAFIQTYIHSQRVTAERTGEPFDRSLWDPNIVQLSTMMVNAFYSPQHNSIFICSGILSDMIYDSSMTYEEMLAGIGTIVGHEITHGFDSMGMGYDKDGNKGLFLPAEDQMKFNNKASGAQLLLTSLRPVPGAGYYDGKQVVAETLADMGGMKLCVLAAEKKPDFDYDRFFRAYTEHWARSVSPEVENAYFKGDPHPLNFLRSNLVLAQFEKFYETYGITESDNMYIAPEKRIAIW